MSDNPETDHSLPDPEAAAAVPAAPADPPADPVADDAVGDSVPAKDEAPVGEAPAEDEARAQTEEGAEAPGAEPAPAGTPRGTRLLRDAVIGALILALVAGGAAGGWALGWWGTAEPAAAPVGTPTPTGSPMVSPFAGTPAEHFAEGADGIVLPPAEPVGEFTAQEVAEALELVKQALIAARLDETMLINHDPDKFLSLLAPDQRGAVQQALGTNEAGAAVTRISDDVGFASERPRVNAILSYDAEIVQGRDQVIRIETESIWIYPLAGADKEALVVVHDESTWRVRGSDWLDSSRGLWLSMNATRAWGADCDALEDGILRPATGSRSRYLLDPMVFEIELKPDVHGGC